MAEPETFDEQFVSLLKGLAVAATFVFGVFVIGTLITLFILL